MDLQLIRTALLITLSILLVVVLLRRFRRGVIAKDLPVNAHAELLSLDVAYHPARLQAVVRVPIDQILHTGLVDEQDHHSFAWTEVPVKSGTQTLERPLPPLEDGVHRFEMRTTTQRTVRQFTMRQG